MRKSYSNWTIHVNGKKKITINVLIIEHGIVQKEEFN